MIGGHRPLQIQQEFETQTSLLKRNFHEEVPDAGILNNTHQDVIVVLKVSMALSLMAAVLSTWF